MAKTPGIIEWPDKPEFGPIVPDYGEKRQQPGYLRNARVSGKGLPIREGRTANNAPRNRRIGIARAASV